MKSPLLCKACFDYHRAILPAAPRSSVAVVIPKARNTRLIVGMLMLYPRSIRDI